MKLTKSERKRHEKALELLHSYPAGKHRHTLIDCDCGNKDDGCEDCDDGWITVSQYIFTHFHPGSCHDVGKCANFFTPYSDAREVVYAEGSPIGRILEPTAGIGVIADTVLRFALWNNALKNIQITCVELVPEFVEIGKILVPEARWIRGNILDVIQDLGEFDHAVGNPPFGKIPSNTSKNGFGNAIEFAILDAIIPRCKHGGSFIMPPGSHGFDFASEGSFIAGNKPVYQRWKKIHPEWKIEPSCFQLASNQWKGASIRCEVCTVVKDEDYIREQEEERERARRGQEEQQLEDAITQTEAPITKHQAPTRISIPTPQLELFTV